MARYQAFKDLNFLDVMSTAKEGSLTTKEIATKLGCSNALAFARVKALAANGLAEEGPPGFNGAARYYRASAPGPEVSIPKVKIKGTYRTFDFTTKALLANPITNNYQTQFVAWAILSIYNAALMDESADKEDKLPTVNQKIRGALIKERSTTKMYIESLDSILNDTYLNNDLESAEAAMQALGEDIDTDKLYALVNELTKAVAK
jgi:hypothetical protein